MNYTYITLKGHCETDYKNCAEINFIIQMKLIIKKCLTKSVSSSTVDSVNVQTSLEDVNTITPKQCVKINLAKSKHVKKDILNPADTKCKYSDKCLYSHEHDVKGNLEKDVQLLKDEMCALKTVVKEIIAQIKLL